MSVRRRQVTYYSLRAGATLAFLTSAFILPRGPLAGGLCIAAGLVAVFAGIGANAGGPGEQAGARRQTDYVKPVPQGDWPPFDPGRDIEGEVVDPDGRLRPP
jgi:hypothetical protein